MNRRIATLAAAAVLGAAALAPLQASARGGAGYVAAGVAGGVVGGVALGVLGGAAVGAGISQEGYGYGYDGGPSGAYAAARYGASVVDSYDPPLVPRVAVPRFDPNVSGYRPEFGVVGWYGRQAGGGYEPVEEAYAPPSRCCR